MVKTDEANTKLSIKIKKTKRKNFFPNLLNNSDMNILNDFFNI